MTSAKDTMKPHKASKGQVTRNLSAWAQERARLLREAVKLALSQTRRAGKTCAFKTRAYEAIRADYAGRELPQGKRLRLSPSRFVRFIQSARRGGAGSWGFLASFHYAMTPDPDRAEKRAERARQGRERRKAQAARREAWAAALASAAPVDPAEAIEAGEGIAGREMRRTWQERRAAILTLALSEIEARAAAGTFSIHKACRLAARHYGRADIGDGRTMRTAPETFRRAFHTWQAGGRTPEAIRLKYGQCKRPARITDAQEAACIMAAWSCALSPARAARELSRRFALPVSERTLNRHLAKRGLPHYRRKCAAPQAEITAALDRLATLFPERDTATT